MLYPTLKTNYTLMNMNTKAFFKLLYQSVVFWGITVFCYGIFRYYGLGIEEEITIKKGFEGRDTFIQLLVIFTFMGMALGALYALVDFVFEKIKSKKMSLGLDLSIKLILHFLATILLVSLTRYIASNIMNIDFDEKPKWWFINKRFWSFIFYIVIFSVVFSFIKIAIERFGSGVFF